MYRVVVRAATDVEKCINLLETKPTVTDKEDAMDLSICEKDIMQKKAGTIEFRNVSFKYRSDSKIGGGINNVSFRVEPGTMLGIVGASGSLNVGTPDVCHVRHLPIYIPIIWAITDHFSCCTRIATYCDVDLAQFCSDRCWKKVRAY